MWKTYARTDLPLWGQRQAQGQSHQLQGRSLHWPGWGGSWSWNTCAVYTGLCLVASCMHWWFWSQTVLKATGPPLGKPATRKVKEFKQCEAPFEATCINKSLPSPLMHGSEKNAIPLGLEELYDWLSQLLTAAGYVHGKACVRKHNIVWQKREYNFCPIQQCSFSNNTSI